MPFEFDSTSHGEPQLIAKNDKYSEKALVRGIQDDFIESFGKAAMTMGHKRITGMVFSVLFLSEVPLSLDDITEELQTSKATICGTVKDLLKLNFIQKSWVKGSRKDFYIVDRSINSLIQNALHTMISGRLQSTVQFVQGIQSKLEQMKDCGVEETKISLYESKLSDINRLNFSLEKIITQINDELSLVARKEISFVL